MGRKKEILNELKVREIDLREAVGRTKGTSDFKLFVETVALIQEFIEGEQCMKCKTILDDSDVSSIVPAVMEDPVKTIIHTCPNCGFEIGRQYEAVWNENDDDEVPEVDLEELGKAKAEAEEGWNDR